MSQLALYRKYRSQTFSDLIGQDHVVRTLQSGISTGRFAHAYLFTGPRGTGKTSTARLLAKALNCEKGPAAEPCNECEACVSITAGNSMDVLEMDAASESGVDDVREAIVQASEYKPTYCRFRVFIIDEVHDLSGKAFDALLKTIEEPPEHVVFILATTEFHKVPPTIRSRCQRFEFHRGSIQNVAARLAHVAQAEGFECEPAAISAIARMADGGFRDALTLLDQAFLTSDGKVTLQQVYDQLGLISDESADAIIRAMRNCDIKEIVERLDAVYRSGRDPRSIVESLLIRLAELTRAAYGVDSGTVIDASSEAALTAVAAEIGKETLLRMRSELATTHKSARDVSLPRIWIESEIVRIASMGTEAPPPPTRTAKPVQERAKAVEPIVATPAPTGDKEFDRLASVWHSVVQELSSQSKVARERLPGSRFGRVEGNRATIEFDRQSDAEWAVEGVKIHKAIMEAWQRLGGSNVQLEFVATKRNGARPQVDAVPTVECPAEGESLEKLGREVFGLSESPNA